MHATRYDIQGLRAWAVIAVVIFHFFPAVIPFGFLGVDVFFVLSGYLISLVLEARPFCLATYTNFYFKRLRRIFPLALLIALINIAIIQQLQKGAELKNCIKSAVYSLLFAINLKPQNLEEDYFDALEQANDFFTHYWSLSVEIQFYLLAPFLLHLLKPSTVNSSRVQCYLTVAGAASLLLFLLSAPEKAFDSTPARLWQFLAGATAFHIEQCLSGRRQISTAADPKMSNVSGSASTFVIPMVYALSAFAAAIVCWNQEALYRIGVTVIAASLLTSRQSTPLLCHRRLQLIGDVSYSLYLIHWPIVCMLMQFGIDSALVKLAAMLFAVGLSIMCHFTYEKWYLTLSASATFALVGLLYALSGMMIIGPSTFRLGAPATTVKFNQTAALFEWEAVMKQNITRHESDKINAEFEAHNSASLRFPNCKRKFGGNPFGFCDLKKGNGSIHFLLMGNSYVANFAGMLLEHLQPYYGKIQARSVSECEPLVDTKDRYCPNALPAHKKFEEDVERERPDVLFLVARFIEPNVPLKGPTEKDPLYLSMMKRFRYFERRVKKKVFMLQAFPRPARLSEFEKQRKKLGLPMMSYMPEAVELDSEPMRERVRAIAKNCEKCVIFDIKEMFLNEAGNFTVLDPRTYLRYFDRARHLTIVGRKLVEPMIIKLADEFPRLMNAKYPDNMLEWNSTKT